MSFGDKIINWLWAQVFGPTTSKPKKQEEALDDDCVIKLTANRVSLNEKTNGVYIELTLPSKRIIDANQLRMEGEM